MIRRLRPAAAVLSLFLGAASARAAYSPATTNGWFVFVGRIAGANQSLFRTDLWLFNPDTSNAVTATLTFHGQVATGGPASAPISSAPIVLAARETRFFADVTLSTVPAGDGQVGALEWNSSGNLMGGARVYTTAPTGTFGFFVPAIPITESMGAKVTPADSANVLQAYGVNSGDANFRVSLDVANTSSVAIPVEVRVIDPVNQTIYGGTQNFSVAAKSLLRVGAILQTVGAPAIAGLRITVAVKEGTTLASGGVLAVATTLDNRTNDGFAFVGQRQSGTIVPAEMIPFEDVP